MHRLVLRSHQSPGDVLMLTAAVRDLHRAHPGRYETDVRTSAPDLWLNNPHVTQLVEGTAGVESLEMHYPLVHQSNQRPYHFLHGYAQFLEERLGVRIPVTAFHGDIHLSEIERESPPLNLGTLPKRYWIMIAGGKYDFTAKWWNPASYQKVVDHFRGILEFVQCGEAGHWHPPLRGVTNLVGKTTIREFVRLMHFAEGVVCPVTFAMHLAAAVESRLGGSRVRQCVVIAGGREPPHWEAYPHHQFLHTVGLLPCCASGGCWKSRCQPVGDGDAKDWQNVCEQPVQISETVRIPRCLDMISSEDVIRRIELYLAAGATTKSAAQRNGKPALPTPPREALCPTPVVPTETPTTQIRIDFPHPLSAVLELGSVLRHLQYYHRDWQVSVRVRPGLAGALRGLCHTVTEGGFTPPADSAVRELTWSVGAEPFLRWPSTPAARCVWEEFHLTPVTDLCGYAMTVAAAADEAATELLQTIVGRGPDSAGRFPVVIVDAGEPNGGGRSRPTTAIWASVAQTVGAQGYMPLRFSDDELNFRLSTLPGIDDGEPEQSAVFDLDLLAAVVRRSRLVVGPTGAALRLAAAVGTPGVVLWPTIPSVFNFAPARSVTHLVPIALAELDHEEVLPTRQRRHYALTGYRDFPADILRHVIDRLSTDASPPLPVVSHAIQAQFQETHFGIGHSASPLHSVRFIHGLGDCANFAKLIPLYVRRGYRIGVECTSDKAFLFRAAGAEIVNHARAEHGWNYPPHDVYIGHGRDWQGSKIGWNLSEPPLPDLGDKTALWPEYCASEVRATSLIPAADQDAIREWLSGLPRPIVLLHTKGNTNQQTKSLPDSTTKSLYRELLDRFDGSLILLDWDDRVPRLAHYRVRHLTELGEDCTTERLFALFEQADLFVGVDSGPLHAASLSEIPRVGLWLPGHYPSRYTLPQRRQLNLVLAGPTGARNRYRRIPWNLVEQPGQAFEAGWLADQIVRMLQPAKYLSDDQRAADVQLQQWIGTWCRGPDGTSALGSYADRHRSFDLLFREARQRFMRPMIVETGTIRAEEDWGGAGFFTYLAGAYAHRSRGRLHSVDLSSQNCEFARIWTAVFEDTVTIHCQDSLTFLGAFPESIDILYLDSLDTNEPGHADHAFRELHAGLPRLHERSLILIDDTPTTGGQFTGKGARVVPWLLEHGWQILYAGYQVLLHRRRS